MSAYVDRTRADHNKSERLWPPLVGSSMKRMLSTRLDRLEARVHPAYECPAFLINFISPGDKSVTRTLVMELGKPYQWLPGPPESRQRL
jgi:hypothetical protein